LKVDWPDKVDASLRERWRKLATVSEVGVAKQVQAALDAK
jgi:hypothetical protein